MSDETTLPVTAEQLGTVDIHHAPVVFFDNVGTFGSYNNIFALTLVLNLARPGRDAVINQTAVAAYLRTNREGLLSLRDGIDQALLSAETAKASPDSQAN